MKTADINYFEANRALSGELGKVFEDFGWSFGISSPSSLVPTPDKGYTARASSVLSYKARRVGDNGNMTTIMFTVGDGTGNRGDISDARILPKWTPRRKKGEAELYITIGSSIDGKWISGLTCLDAVTLADNEPSGVRCYKQLTTEEFKFLEIAEGRGEYQRLGRFDFTFDRKEDIENPHAVGFFPALSCNIENGMNIDYQIGTFVSFPRPCEALDILREKVRSDYAE